MKLIRLFYPEDASDGRLQFSFNEQIHIRKGSRIALTEMAILLADELYITEGNNTLEFSVNGYSFTATIEVGAYDQDLLLNLIRDAMHDSMTCHFVQGDVGSTLAGVQFSIHTDNDVITIAFDSQNPTKFSPRTDVGCLFDSNTRIITKSNATAGYAAWSTDTINFCFGPGYYCATILQLGGSVSVGLAREQLPSSGDPEEMFCAIVADDTTGTYLLIEDQNETDTGIAWQVNDMFGIKRTLGVNRGVYFRAGVETVLEIITQGDLDFNDQYPIISLAGPLGYTAMVGSAANDENNVFHCVEPFNADLPPPGKNVQTVAIDFGSNPYLADMLGFEKDVKQIVAVEGEFDGYRTEPFRQQLLSLRVSCPTLAGTIDAYDTTTGGAFPILASVVKDTTESNYITYKPWNPVEYTLNYDVFLSDIVLRIDDVDEDPVALQQAAAFTLVVYSPDDPMDDMV